MTCESCADKGLIKTNWADAPTAHYAVCLCAVGQAWRCDENAGKRVEPHWVVWAYEHQVPLENMWLIEDVLSPAELAERGLSSPSTPPPAAAREAALMAAGRTRKGPS